MRVRLFSFLPADINEILIQFILPDPFAVLCARLVCRDWHQVIPWHPENSLHGVIWGGLRLKVDPVTGKWTTSCHFPQIDVQLNSRGIRYCLENASGETLFSLVRGLLELDEDVAKSVAQNARILAVGLGHSGKFYDNTSSMRLLMNRIFREDVCGSRVTDWEYQEWMTVFYKRQRREYLHTIQEDENDSEFNENQ